MTYERLFNRDTNLSEREENDFSLEYSEEDVYDD